MKQSEFKKKNIYKEKWLILIKSRIKGAITTNISYTQKIIKQYSEQLYKLNNLDDRAKFLERHKLLNVIEEEIENLSIPLKSKGSELAI